MKGIENWFPAFIHYFSQTLSNIFKLSVISVECIPLMGDASDREYFRLKFNSQENKISSVVLMRSMDPPIGEKMSFVIMLAYLKECGINVPELHLIDREKGFLFLEDLGDVTLEEKLKTSSPAEQERYYKKAIDILVEMQIECTGRINRSIPAYHLAFDDNKLLWELDFMKTHFIEGYLKKTISEKEKRIIDDGFLKICSCLSKQNRYFCHRDYHSMNIMVSNGDFTLLDFQDAMMGPCHYDLASLLRDSYFKLTPNLLKNLLNYYLNKKEEKNQAPINREKFLKVFDWMSIQRNLKALGTFGYQIHIRKNERYIEAIPRTIEYIYDNLSKYSELRELKQCLNIL